MSENYEGFYNLFGSEKYLKVMDLLNRMGIEDSTILSTSQGQVGIYKPEFCNGSYMLYFGDFNTL